MTTLDQKLAELLNNYVVDGWPIGNFILVFIAIVLSLILCGAIGMERERKGRSAGLRTHLLVGVGSCIIMVISIYGFPAMFAEKRDVARLAAQIVTGVGFLGAGAIIHRNSDIKGLTTAGTIWIVMAIGIACGSFNFIIAIVSAVVILLVLVVFKKMEAKISKRHPLISLSASSEEPIIEKVLTVSKEFDCTIYDLSTNLIESGDTKMVQCTFKVKFLDNEWKLNEYLSRLEKETKASSIELLNSHR